MITTVTNSVEIHAAHALTVVGSASIGCPRQAHSLTAVVEAHHPETQEVLADCQLAPRDERNLEKEPHQEKLPTMLPSDGGTKRSTTTIMRTRSTKPSINRARMRSSLRTSRSPCTPYRKTGSNPSRRRA